MTGVSRSLVDGLEQLGRLVAVHWLLAAAVLILVGALLRVLPKSSAATRHAVWLAALVLSALLPFGALLVAVDLAPSALRPVAVDQAVNRTTDRAGEVLGSAVGAIRSLVAPVSTAGAEPVSGAADLARERAAPGDAASNPVRGSSLLWAGLALAWCVAVTRRARHLVGAWQRTSRLQSRIEDPRPALAGLMRSVLERLSPGSRITVGELPDVDHGSSEVEPPTRAPFCVGVLRPRVVVPVSWLESASMRDRELALVHEAAHGQRRDGLALLVQQLADCLLPFHPIAAQALRQLDIERESSCDDVVLATGVTPRHYGESLLRQAANRLHSDLLLTAYLDSPSRLARRLHAMIDPRRSRSLGIQWGPTLAVTALLAGSAAASLAAWPTFSWSSETIAAVVGVALEEGHGHRRGSDHRHDHEGHYAGRTVRSADDSSLYPAIRSGDVDRVVRLLDAGEDPNEVWPGDGSPLMVAAHQGDREMVDVLLRRGADVDLAVGGDGTPLIGAVRSRRLDLVQTLIDAGADIDDAGFGGDGNPLIAASLAGDIVTARYLVQQGATIDLHVPDDDTPLINAAQQGHVDLVRYLLDEGADPNLTGDFDRRLNRVRTPLNQAEKGGHDDVAQLLRAAGARE